MIMLAVELVIVVFAVVFVNVIAVRNGNRIRTLGCRSCTQDGASKDLSWCYSWWEWLHCGSLATADSDNEYDCEYE